MSNLENKINSNRIPDVGKIIDSSLDTFKKTIWVAGIGVFLMCLLIIPLTFSIIFKVMDIKSLEHFIKISPKLAEDFNYLLLNAAIGIPLAGFIAIFTAGFYKINHLAKQDKEFGLNNLFDYFRSPQFIQLFICGVLTALYSDVLGLSLVYLKLSVFATLIQLFITILFILSIPIIIFENQTALQAMSISSRIAMKHPFSIILCLSFGLLIAILGVFAFCIGIFFSISYFYTINYTLYKEILPIDEHIASENSELN
jgi:hypothetical protein